MMKHAQIVGMVLVAVVMVGCHTVNSTERANPRSAPNMVEDHRVITDGFLNEETRIVGVREAEVHGLLKIQVDVYNNMLRRERFTYKYDWIDTDGMVIETEMSRWIPMSLAGKEMVTLSGVAPSPNAVDFRLKMIRTRD